MIRLSNYVPPRLLTIVGLLILFIAIVFIALRQRFNFLVPTGTYMVGKTRYHLVDAQRAETNTSDHSLRELMLHIWYPTNISKQHEQYDKDAVESAQEFFHESSGFPSFVFKNIFKITTNSSPNVAIADNQEAYPVIILLHGSGTMIQHYTWIAEELASNGYVVIGINHPYMAAVTRFTDDRIIKTLVNQKRGEGKLILQQWKQEQFEVAIGDIQFVIDSLNDLNQQVSLPFYTKLDLERVGICGHSSGGSLAMRMCLEDSRIKAGISLDGSIRGSEALTPFATPFLLVLADKSHVHLGPEGVRGREQLRELCHKPGMHMSIVTIKEVGHGTFSDLPLLLDSTYATQLLSHVISVDIGASSSRAIQAIKKMKPIIINFFDHILRDKPASNVSNESCDLIVDVV